jgi:hypothetical protein
MLRVSGGDPKIIGSLEEAVWKWVGIPDEALRPVLERLNESVAPEGRLRYHLLPLDEGSQHRPADNTSRARRLRPGAVLSVGDQTVTLSISGLTKERGRRVPIPQRLPGAALRPGTTVTAVDDGQPIAEMAFLFDEVAYLSSEELSQELIALAAH